MLTTISIVLLAFACICNSFALIFSFRRSRPRAITYSDLRTANRIHDYLTKSAASASELVKILHPFSHEEL